MYYQRKEFRSIFTRLQLAAVCATAISLATAPVARAQSCTKPPVATMVAWYSFDDQTRLFFPGTVVHIGCEGIRCGSAIADHVLHRHLFAHQHGLSGKY